MRFTLAVAGIVVMGCLLAGQPARARTLPGGALPSDDQNGGYFAARGGKL